MTSKLKGTQDTPQQKLDKGNILVIDLAAIPKDMGMEKWNELFNNGVVVYDSKSGDAPFVVNKEEIEGVHTYDVQDEEEMKELEKALIEDNYIPSTMLETTEEEESTGELDVSGANEYHHVTITSTAGEISNMTFDGEYSDINATVTNSIFDTQGSERTDFAPEPARRRTRQTEPGFTLTDDTV